MRRSKHAGALVRRSRWRRCFKRLWMATRTGSIRFAAAKRKCSKRLPSARSCCTRSAMRTLTSRGSRLATSSPHRSHPSRKRSTVWVRLPRRIVIDRARARHRVDAMRSAVDCIGGCTPLAWPTRYTRDSCRIRRDVHDDAQVGDSRIQVSAVLKPAMDCFTHWERFALEHRLWAQAAPLRFSPVAPVAPHAALRICFGKYAKAN